MKTAKTAAVNTHGLKIDLDSLKECSAYTETLYNGSRVDIFYDRRDGQVWGKFEVSENNWTQYHDPEIVRICGTRRHHSAQWIADRIAETVAELRHIANYLGVPYADDFQ